MEEAEWFSGALGTMNEEVVEVPAFACCSVGIGRWFWVAWASESDARGLAPPVASGYEKSADRAEQKAVERLGSEVKRLPARWASRSKSGGAATRSLGPRREGEEREGGPRSRLGRSAGRPGRDNGEPRLAFLYSVIAREPPDSLGHVTVTRHRIVKQTAGKIHVEREPFDEDEWARRAGRDAGAHDTPPRPRTLAVDRLALRREGRFHVGRANVDLTFYVSEQAGTSDVEATLTARYAWCEVLGVRFPCSVETIKAEYRRLAFASHPDRGGDAAVFRSVEQAYRAALAYFSKGDDATD